MVQGTPRSGRSRSGGAGGGGPVAAKRCRQPTASDRAATRSASVASAAVAWVSATARASPPGAGALTAASAARSPAVTAWTASARRARGSSTFAPTDSRRAASPLSASGALVRQPDNCAWRDCPVGGVGFPNLLATQFPALPRARLPGGRVEIGGLLRRTGRRALDVAQAIVGVGQARIGGGVSKHLAGRARDLFRLATGRVGLGEPVVHRPGSPARRRWRRGGPVRLVRRGCPPLLRGVALILAVVLRSRPVASAAAAHAKLRRFPPAGGRGRRLGPRTR